MTLNQAEIVNSFTISSSAGCTISLSWIAVLEMRAEKRCSDKEFRLNLHGDHFCTRSLGAPENG